MGMKVAGARQVLTDYTSARDYFVSLHTAGPTSANELSGGGYKRLELPKEGWTVAAASVIENGERRLKATNSAAAAYPTPTAAWGDPTHAAFNPAAAGFAPHFDGPLGADVAAPAIGATVRFNANDFSLYLVVDD